MNLSNFVTFRDIDGTFHCVSRDHIVRLQATERVGESTFQHGAGFLVVFSDGGHAWVYQGEGERLIPRLLEEQR